MLYVADTHILIKYLSKILPRRLETIFNECEIGKHTIFVPTIVLAESYYLIKKNKVSINLQEVITKIEGSENFRIVPFNLDILKLFFDAKEFELHDLIIVATSKYLNAKLITQDKDIIRSKNVEVIS